MEKARREQCCCLRLTPSQRNRMTRNITYREGNRRRELRTATHASAPSQPAENLKRSNMEHSKINTGEDEDENQGPATETWMNMVGFIEEEKRRPQSASIAPN